MFWNHRWINETENGISASFFLKIEITKCSRWWVWHIELYIGNWSRTWREGCNPIHRFFGSFKNVSPLYGALLYFPREMFVFSTVSLNHPAPIPLHMFNFDQMHTLHDYYLRWFKALMFCAFKKRLLRLFCQANNQREEWAEISVCAFVFRGCLFFFVLFLRPLLCAMRHISRSSSTIAIKRLEHYQL